MIDVIGFTGLKSSGKSTAAEYLIEEYGFELVSFAQPLKASVAALFDITVEEIELWKNESACTVTLTTPSGMKATMPLRVFLQRYGTEAHREIPEFGQNCWSDMAESKLLGKGPFVIADVRFDNEAAVIHRVGGKTFRVVRDAVVSDDGHASESGLSPMYIDSDIDNNGYIYDLYERLDLLVNGLVQA